MNLKFAATGTETEAVDRLLDFKVAKNVQKRKNKRKDFCPTGPARHDPTSPEWVSVLTEQVEKKKPASKKNKEDPKQVEVEQQNNKQKKGPAKFPTILNRWPRRIKTRRIISHLISMIENEINIK